MIKLQFALENDASAKAIQVFQRGWPSHVDAVLPDGSLLGARLAGGVQIRQPGYAPFTRTQLVTLDAAADRFHGWLHQQIGKPYDSLAIAAFAVERDWRRPDSYFCSELIACGLEVGGFFPRPLSNTANEITPRDLLLIVSPWDVS